MPNDPYTLQRRRMIDDQLLPRGITNPNLLAALDQIPRHLFVPEKQLPRAYDDAALPTHEGQTISQPFMVARMTQELDPQPGDHILEIGTGTGYQTAILSQLVQPTGQIYTIERSLTLSLAAQQLLTSLHLTNIHYHIGDGSQGWPQPTENPSTPPILFDRILLTAGTPTLPQPLLDQLKIPGTLIAPIGPEQQQTLTRILRHPTHIETTPLFACRFVPLIGQHAWPV